MRASDLIALGALDDEMGDDDVLLGAVRQQRGLMRRVAQRAGKGGGRAPITALRRTLVPTVPGVPSMGGREEPLGFGTFVFGAATAQVAQLVATPQKPFKGSRLVLSIFRTAGAAAIGLNITSLFVGQANQLVSAQPIPADAFAPGAFNMELNLDPATPGILISLNLATTAAPAGADTVTVTGMIIGLTFS